MRRPRHIVVAGFATAIIATGGYIATHQNPTPKTAAQIAPGALADPQPTTAQLCTPGYTATVRPPESYTSSLKRRQMKIYRLPGNPTDYEEDHQVPLELGGNPTDERNLWPQPWPDAHKKDRQENAWHASVCAGRASLAEAQSVFLQSQWSRVTAP